MSVTGCTKQWEGKKKKSYKQKKERTIRANAKCHWHGGALSCKTSTLGWQSLLVLGDTNEQATCCIITDDNINKNWEENFLTPQ